MSTKDLLFVCLLFVSGSAGVFCLMLSSRVERLRRNNVILATRLQHLARQKKTAPLPGRSASAAQAEPWGDFSSVNAQTKSHGAFVLSLEQARMKSRLKQAGAEGDVPEKYRLVRSLALKGLSARDISEILGISLGETEQLIKLTRVSGHVA